MTQRRVPPEEPQGQTLTAKHQHDTLYSIGVAGKQYILSPIKETSPTIPIVTHINSIRFHRAKATSSILLDPSSQR